MENFNKLKNSTKKILSKNYIFIFILSVLMIINISLNFIYLDKSLAQNNLKRNYGSTFKENETYSIFIKEPIFSFIHLNNLYFYDSFDKNLKIYNLNEDKFYSNYLNLSQYGDLIDFELFDEHIFCLFSKNNSNIVVKLTLDIDNLLAETILNNENIQNNNYKKINITSHSSNYIITLTPNINLSTNTIYVNPKIFIIEKSNNNLVNEKELSLNSSLNTTIKSSLIKIILYSSNSTTDYYNLLLICNDELYATNISNTQIYDKSTLDIKYTNFRETLDPSNIDNTKYNSISILSTNLLNIDNKYLLSISYQSKSINNKLASYTKLYEINLSQFTNESTFNLSTSFTTSITSYICVSENYISYPDNQTIVYKKINFNNESIIFDDKEIKNPNITINYYENNDFIYSKTNKTTSLLSAPWSSNETIQIDANTDLIIIGDGCIESQNSVFADYKYCLFTNFNKNYFGFVKTENLTPKEIISIPENQKICTVIPNTPLYSLPTKFDETICETLVSKKIMNIQEYSKIEILDMICNYTSSSTLFVKVRVNDNQVGYIDYNQIQNKNNINIHITNNATIKTDNVSVYLNEDKTSPVIQNLKTGTRIQVIGSRNRKTGLTNVKFTDEYGNLFSGYILSDYIEVDGWTNMQILGSIFIAINLGVLILILLFKKKRLITRASKDITKSKFDS